MRALYHMDTIQVEITDACIHSCSNCTRFCGHRPPFFMPFEMFKDAIETMIDYPKMTGLMGGEPLLHPQFGEFLQYAGERIPRERLGLWTCFPEGAKYTCYREAIAKYVGNIFLNDHSRNDIYHQPILVAVEEVIPDEKEMWLAIDSCWLQNSWSATINPKGAYFCEVAGAMSLLFDGSPGWKVEPRWWMRTPKDFREQMEEFCRKCGMCLPLRRRKSIEEVDDVSPKNLERLQAIGSYKVKKGEVRVHDLKCVDDPEEMAKYKDNAWRNRIAARYGMFLTINPKGFWDPHLKESFDAQDTAEQLSLFAQYQAALVAHESAAEQPWPPQLLQIAGPPSRV